MTNGTGGDAVVATLRAAGIDTLFGIPGGHNIDLFDAVVRDGSIRAVLPRHEQGAGFMADGYARVGARTGVIACLEGPGMGNVMTALGEALQDSSPVLVVSSQIKSDLHDRGFGVIHELPNHLETFHAATRFSARAATVDEIPSAIAGALAAHGRGRRPGPSHVEIPEDVLAAVGSWSAPLNTDQASKATAETESALDRAASLIAAGRRPVILAGAGTSRGCAEDELTAFAEHIGAPVLTTALGKGAIREDHPLYVATTSLWSPWISEGPVAHLIASADPLIVVGSRLTDATTNNWQMPAPSSIIRIDVEQAPATNVYTIDVEVTCDAAVGLAALRALVPGRESTVSEAGLSTARRFPVDHARRSMSDGFDLVTAISTVLGPDTVLMGDSLIGLWGAVAWRTNRPRRYHVPMHFNTLGFALPAAIGAKLANPSAPTVALAGDGAFMFTMAELSAAVQEEVPIIAIVCNDGGFESIRRQQRAKFGGRMISVDIRTPDFAAFARSVGADGFTVRDLADFPTVLETAATTGRASLIEVPLSVAPPWEPL